MKAQPVLKNKLILLLGAICIMLLTGCITPSQQHKKYISRILADDGIKTEKQLYNFFMDAKPNADKDLVQRLAHYYVTEAKAEGINSDCAFVQMCLETGWLSFGNLVTIDMHNYCGLGAIDKDHPGEYFDTEQMGVRAHIQHLHAYATTSDIALKNKLIDNRYKYVLPRGKAPTIYGLAGTWAADKEYGIKLDKLLKQLETY
ncbi:MAG: glucosaminidase domain-containing protein [Treponema sp.]|nr:glucosaminidase domain-containing protein [Treponema sp.]